MKDVAYLDLSATDAVTPHGISDITQFHVSDQRRRRRLAQAPDLHAPLWWWTVVRTWAIYHSRWGPELVARRNTNHNTNTRPVSDTSMNDQIKVYSPTLVALPRVCQAGDASERAQV